MFRNETDSTIFPAGPEILDTSGRHPQMGPSQFLEIVNTINRATTLDGLFKTFTEAAPMELASYHHFPSVGAFDFTTLGTFYAYNLSPAIEEYYRTYDMLRADPVIIQVFAKGSFVWLSDLVAQPTLFDGAQKKRAKAIMNYLGDALCIPLFGPNNRRGYMFTAGDIIKKKSGALLPYQLQALAIIFHLRFCLMIQTIQRQINLTPREAQVLELLTYGKTNQDIADILDISVSTVSGYLKAIFIKLDVSDRVSASMRALSMKVVF